MTDLEFIKAYADSLANDLERHRRYRQELWSKDGPVYMREHETYGEASKRLKTEKEESLRNYERQISKLVFTIQELCLHIKHRDNGVEYTPNSESRDYVKWMYQLRDAERATKV